VCAVGAYWGLGIAGPSAWPAVIMLLAIVALSIVLAAAMWNGSGGRKVAVLSLSLGLLLAGLSLADPWGEDPGITSGNVGGALFGLAIILASAFALRGYQRAPR
jgi:hypothetical protein